MLKKVKFDEILGVDQVTAQQLEHAGIQISIPFDIRHWERGALISYLEMRPPIARKAKLGYWIIGGFREYILAQALFNERPDLPLTIFCYEGRLSNLDRTRLIQQDLLLQGALYQNHPSNKGALFRLWQSQKELKAILLGQLDKDFDQAMGMKMWQRRGRNGSH